MDKIDNIRIENFVKLITPLEVRKEIPLSEKANRVIVQGRNSFCNILVNKDNRFVVIVGPCSIHDKNNSFEYAEKLKILSDKFSKKLFIMPSFPVGNSQSTAA